MYRDCTVEIPQIMTKYKSTSRKETIPKGIKLTISITVSQEVEKGRERTTLKTTNFHNRMSKYTLKCVAMSKT